MSNQSQTNKGKKKQLPAAIAWTLFGIAAALAVAMAITMCVIAMR